MRLLTQVLASGALVCAAFLFAGAQPQPPAGKPGDNKNQPGQPVAPRFDAARFIKDHDKNNDGKLSKDELPAAAQNEFAAIDTNKDGFITQDELQKHAEAMANGQPRLVEVVWYAIDVAPEPLTTDELQEAYDQLRQIDKNNNGKIEPNELAAFRDQRKKERIDGIFTALDKNKDGKISKDEARGLWADDFAALDKNKDGMLDRQEVEAACAAHHGGKSAQPNPGQPNPGQPKK